MRQSANAWRGDHDFRHWKVGGTPTTGTAQPAPGIGPIPPSPHPTPRHPPHIHVQLFQPPAHNNCTVCSATLAWNITSTDHSSQVDGSPNPLNYAQSFHIL